MFQPVVLVLASGRGERFSASGGGVHKLQALLHGKPVLQHTLDAVRSSGLPWHLENSGQSGMGDSIAAAVQATHGADGWLVLPGDLPLVSGHTMRLLATALRFETLVVPIYRGQRGHPVGFAASMGAALAGLRGDRGAGVLLQRHKVKQLVVGDVGCISDIDTVADLQAAHRWLLATDMRGSPRP